MKQKLSNYVADFLVKNGITDVFTVTGGGAMHLNDAFGHQPGLKCTYNHHEQACSIAAESYARLTNKLAGVCVTTGPGGTNAITGVMGGWLDSIPMFIISGQVKRETTVWSTGLPLRQLGDQEFNIVDCVKTMTKYAVMVTEPSEISYHLEKALYICKNGRPGPVWIDIPLDVQAAIIETEELKHFSEAEERINETPVYDENISNKIIEKLKESKRPVIYAGTGIRIAGVVDEFIKLVEKWNVPVVTACNAHDIIWDEHPLYCGRPGSAGLRGGNFVVQNSDLVISFGCRLSIRQVSYNYKEFAKDAYKIVIDIDGTELKKPTIKLDMPINADVKDVINSLLKLDYTANNEKHKEWLKWSRNIHEKYPVVLPKHYDKTKPLNPYAFLKELFKDLKEEERIVASNGSAFIMTFQAAEIKKGQRLYTNSGCASMGYGLPAAIGAAVAENDRRIICLEGDGSMQMNVQELATVAYNNINLKIFLFNNNGYHSIRQTQTSFFTPPMVGVNKDTGVGFPSYRKIADAYGIKYSIIDSLDNINKNITDVLNAEGPILCEVMVDEKQNFEPKLSSKALPDGTIVSPELDDMFPFIDREEYEEIKQIKKDLMTVN